jgi:RNA polymerase sigma-70 factor (ECF subfamily)
MSETSASLLDQLRLHPDDAAWQRLADIYTPLIRGWLRRQALPEQDADDLVQEVLTVVFRRLPEFRRGDRTGSVRRWLRTITVNCLRDHWRARRGRPRATGDSDFLQMLEQLEDPDSGLSRLWDEEHNRHVTRHLLALIRPSFEARTWQAFERVALEDASPDEVAAELGMSVNAVFIAKSRVLTVQRYTGLEDCLGYHRKPPTERGGAL